MKDERHVVDVDEESHWWRESPIRECADCGGTKFKTVVDFDLVLFECVACGSAWHVELGHIYRVRRVGGEQIASEVEAAT
jgi:Zn ribbon nucleic-acid-binding protein